MLNYKYNHKIHSKAKRILEVKKYAADCLEADICPKCGDKLSTNTDDHGFSEMTCTGCRAVYYE